MEDQTFYIGAKAFISKGDNVLVLFKENKDLRIPGGKIQEGEDYITALKREVMEETGLVIETGPAFTTWVHPQKMNGLPIFLVGYRCKYLSGDVVLNEEHADYLWISSKDLDSVNDGSVFFEQLRVYFKT